MAIPQRAEKLVRQMMAALMPDEDIVDTITVEFETITDTDVFKLMERVHRVWDNMSDVTQSRHISARAFIVNESLKDRDFRTALAGLDSIAKLSGMQKPEPIKVEFVLPTVAKQE